MRVGSSRRRAIILTSALLAWWWHCRSLGTIRLDEGRRIATLLLQFRAPLECRCQLLLELGYQDAQFGVLGPQLGIVFLKRHVASIA